MSAAENWAAKSWTDEDGYFRAEGKDSSLTLSVQDYENQFRILIKSLGPSECTLFSKDARALRDYLNRFFPRAALINQEPGQFADRMTALIELLSAEPEANRLALVSFIAGYFGYRVASI